LVEVPWRGITQALVRARIPYISVHADHIDRDAAQLKLLILPNFGSMTPKQVASVKRFVEGGGNLFATQNSSLYNETGARLKDYALSDLFGAHYIVPQGKVSNQPLEGATRSTVRTLHTYLRLNPELRSKVYGPQTGTEPAISSERHEVLKGFELTDILPFGGVLAPVKTDNNSQVIMTFIPEFPIYPPETAWMREPKTDIPGLILKTMANGSRVAFMPADIDSQFAHYNLPDHGNLLNNIIRWASKDEIPLSVEGPGLIDCNLYEQNGKMILHLTNLTSAGTWRAPVDEYIPVGPITINVKLSTNVNGEYPSLLVAGQRITAKVEDGWSKFQIASILNHEVVVLT
jgi:hypothetical protein